MLYVIVPKCKCTHITVCSYCRWRSPRKIRKHFYIFTLLNSLSQAYHEKLIKLCCSPHEWINIISSNKNNIIQSNLLSSSINTCLISSVFTSVLQLLLTLGVPRVSVVIWSNIVRGCSQLLGTSFIH